MPTLTGKTALVTGASRGMGRASALALAAAGAQVLVHYGRGAKEADGVVAEIRKAGGRADAIATDLAAADGASKLARQARSIVGDRLDILVANAGVSKAATIEETTVEDFDKLFAVNVRAPFFLVQQLLPIMSEGKQHRFPLVARGARRRRYDSRRMRATKGAIDTLVKHFASVLGPRGIRVNAVAPGVIETDMSNFTKTEEGRDFVLGMQALKRIASPTISARRRRVPGLRRCPVDHRRYHPRGRRLEALSLRHRCQRCSFSMGRTMSAGAICSVQRPARRESRGEAIGAQLNRPGRIRSGPLVHQDDGNRGRQRTFPPIT